METSLGASRVSTSRLARGFAGLFLAYMLVATLMPLQPSLPQRGLDPGWMLGMNQAVAQGLQFGKDVVFTYGPYAAVDTQNYHPATDARMLWGSAYLAASFALVLFLLLRGRSAWQQGALALVIGLCGNVPEAVILSYPLAAGLLACRVAEDDERPGSRVPWLLAAAFLPFGELALVKGSMLLLCAAVSGIACLGFLAKRQWARACIPPAAFALGFLVFWMLAAQPLSGVPAYLETLGHIIAGYGDAMSVHDEARHLHPLVYAAAALAVGVVAFFAHPRGMRAGVALMLAAALFLGFKAGFVRHDDIHSWLGASCLALAAALVASTTPLVPAALLLLSGLAGWYAISADPGADNRVVFTDRIFAVATQPVAGLVARASGELQHNYADRMRRLRDFAALPALEERTDVYSFGQTDLIASGSAWHSRPILQSYSAYTPQLAALNREHLLGSDAPQKILFRVEPIDGRLASQEDGPSWPVLLGAYRPAGVRGGSLLLERQGDAFAAEEPVAKLDARIGDWVPIPASDRPLMARLQMRKTPLGIAASVLYKLPPVRIVVRLAGGTTAEYRLVPAMAVAGMMISPVIDNTTEFGLLYGDARFLRHKRVTAFRVIAPASFWQGGYQVAFGELPTRPTEDAQAVVGIQPFMAAPPRERFVAASRCDGHLELINARPPADASFSDSWLLSAKGWLAGRDAEETSRGDVVLVLSDARGKRWIATATRMKRYDLFLVRKEARLLLAGYHMTAHVAGLRGDHWLQVGVREGNEVRLCPGTPIRAHFAL